MSENYYAMKMAADQRQQQIRKQAAKVGLLKRVRKARGGKR